MTDEQQAALAFAIEALRFEADAIRRGLHEMRQLPLSDAASATKPEHSYNYWLRYWEVVLEGVLRAIDHAGATHRALSVQTPKRRS